MVTSAAVSGWDAAEGSMKEAIHDSSSERKRGVFIRVFLFDEVWGRSDGRTIWRAGNASRREDLGVCGKTLCVEITTALSA